ncbi:MAG: agmatinase [Gammaproteobacteria bacterium]
MFLTISGTSAILGGRMRRCPNEELLLTGVLRTAPLPRMAGHLSFMRARRVQLDELRADSLAIVGAPMESAQHRSAGFRFGPRALRETSVYFGWHANAQFSHPVDIDERVQIDTSSIHSRLVDIGDLAIEDMAHERAHRVIRKVLGVVSRSGASSVVLGGDSSIVAPTLDAHLACVSRLGLIQFGGTVAIAGIDNCSQLVVVAPHGALPVEAPARTLSASRSAQMHAADWDEFSAAINRTCDGLVIHVDLSVLQSALHGMADTPRLDGLTLAVLQQALTSIGQANVRCLIVTGLNPTINGMSIVKTGQRLLVTSLLGFIYARLGLIKTWE